VGMGYDSAVSKVTGIGFISGTCPEWHWGPLCLLSNMWQGILFLARIVA
jgi:hypothetical protein